MLHPLPYSHNEQTYRITQIRGIEVLHIEQCRPPVTLLLINGRVQLIPEWTVGNERQYTQPEQHHYYDRWTQSKQYKTYVIHYIHTALSTTQLNCFCMYLRYITKCTTNQSINARFVGRRYTTRPGAPAIVSCKHDQKVHSWVVSGMYSYQ